MQRKYPHYIFNITHSVQRTSFAAMVGSSRAGGVQPNNMQHMVQMLGAPTPIASGDGKVTAAWFYNTPRGTAQVYQYKQAWYSISAHSTAAARWVARYLRHVGIAAHAKVPYSANAFGGYACTHCAQCGAAFVPQGMGTGYAVRNSQRICYACNAQHMVQQMQSTGRAFMFLVARAPHPTPYQVTSWCGTLAYNVTGVRRTKHNRCGHATHVWFIGPCGMPWHGVHMGSNNTMVHCRRISWRAYGKRGGNA
jgi:hypothetical protein